MSKEYILEIKKISKKFISKNGLETIALDNLSMEIEKNEMVAVMGSSGSGKTTLINLLTGLSHSDGGEIYIKGVNITKQTQDENAMLRRKNVGIVFQHYNLIDSLTVEENIKVPLIIDNRLDEQEEKALEVAQLLGIHEYLSKYPYELSGGQKQRVGICRAIINEPDIIFADEPTGNLDAHMTEQVMDYFAEVCRKNKTSLLMVTHDAKAASYCDRVVFLRNGRIEKNVRRSEHKACFYDAILDMQKGDEVCC